MKTLSATTLGITRALIVKLWGNADIYNPNHNFVLLEYLILSWYSSQCVQLWKPFLFLCQARG